MMNLEMNYKNMYTNTKCPRYNKEDDNELHIMKNIAR